MAEKKLSVRDLKISFRTASGKLQAVRDISFDLYKGETLAIVGESGSGKSVTSRAIMGILAGNAIVEGGKILYDGKDLMKISEDEFHRIRGDKIAMVFQDPLSSLNPIMRVGNQLTEAMLLKNKAARREGKAAMDTMFASLTDQLAKSGEASAKEDIEKFKKFELKHCELESQYTAALSYAQDFVSAADNVLLRIRTNTEFDVKDEIGELVHAAEGACSPFVVAGKAADEAKSYTQKLSSLMSAWKPKQSCKEFYEPIEKLQAIMKTASELPVPNTFTLGYYMTFVEDKIPDMPVDKLNAMTRKKLDDDFMKAFLAKCEKAVRNSAFETDKQRSEAISVLKAELPHVQENLEKKSVQDACGRMKAAVAKCLDPLEVTKDGLTHTFGTSIDYAVNMYFDGIVKNEKEKARFAAQTAKYERKVAKGKTPDWQVIPMSLVDLDAAKKELSDIIEEQIAHFEAQIAENKTADYAARTVEIVDYLKECASQSVYKVTKEMAKERAIKLMESVGIDEPRRRFSQYPFEFSGGMRQRIVIAIALTANPDILICDEPTTALDVTIQAQILELINNLKKERNLSVIFITHDLGVVANMADRVAVMYAGKIVETGTARDIFYSPAHPYTWALLSSVPDLDTKEKLESIPGTPPNMIYPPKGDAFADRNKYALEIDFEEQPPMYKIGDTHYAATWLLHPDAPKIDPPKIVLERIEKMRNRRKDKDVTQ